MLRPQLKPLIVDVANGWKADIEKLRVSAGTMRPILTFVVATLFAAPSPASACMSVYLPSAILFDEPPSVVPKGYTVLRVQRLAKKPSGSLLSALTAGAERPTPIWLSLAGMTSCTAIGRMDSPAYVVARPEGFTQGRTILNPLPFDRGWLDRLWSYIGWERFTPSAPATS